MGVTVTFQQTFLNDVLDDSQFISFWTDAPDEAFDTLGEVRVYAGGRRRLVTRPGSTRTISVNALDLDRATKDLLVEWAGRLLLYRDLHGRRMYCTYTAPAVTDPVGRFEAYSVALVMTELTFDESV